MNRSFYRLGKLLRNFIVLYLPLFNSTPKTCNKNSLHIGAHHNRHIRGFSQKYIIGLQCIRLITAKNKCLILLGEKSVIKWGYGIMTIGYTHYLQRSHCVCSPGLGVYQNQLPMAHSLSNKKYQ